MGAEVGGRQKWKEMWPITIIQYTRLYRILIQLRFVLYYAIPKTLLEVKRFVMKVLKAYKTPDSLKILKIKRKFHNPI